VPRIRQVGPRMNTCDSCFGGGQFIPQPYAGCPDSFMAFLSPCRQILEYNVNKLNDSVQHICINHKNNILFFFCALHVSTQFVIIRFHVTVCKMDY
jgi:hypothetical protein